MKKDFKKRVKAAMGGSAIIVIFVGAIILWWLCYNIFSEPTILTDFAKTLNNGSSNALEMTWAVFWIGFPIIILLQLSSCLLMSFVLETKKDKKENKEEVLKKTKRKKTKKK